MRPEPTFVNLSEAHLCSDCEAIGNSATRCPRCQSNALIAVSRALPPHRDRIRMLCRPIDEGAEGSKAAWLRGCSLTTCSQRTAPLSGRSALVSSQTAWDDLPPNHKPKVILRHADVIFVHAAELILRWRKALGRGFSRPSQHLHVI